MADPSETLLAALRSLARQARRVRGVRLTGRAFLAASIALTTLLVSRDYLLGRYGIEILPLARLPLTAALCGLPVLALVAAVLVARFGGPSLVDLARALDSRRRTRDLLASGLAARGRSGEVPGEVVRRAADCAGRLDPVEVFPVRRSLAKTAAVLPLLAALVYLIGIPPGSGPVPAHGGASGGLFAPGKLDAPRAGPVASGKPDPVAPVPPARETGRKEPAPAPARPDRIRAKVVPAKTVYDPEDPVTIFVTAKPDGPLSRAHELSVTLVVDDRPAPTGESITLAAGDDAGGLAMVFAKELPVLAGRLGPGRHRVRARLGEAGGVFETPEVEFEIRGAPGGGGTENRPKPPPPAPAPRRPPPAPGSPPPPPEIRSRPRFVLPLFGPGETREKKGWALVPDPDAPPGTPPRRVPLGQAAREAGRRAESPVPVEQIGAADRALVERYFRSLRGEK